jgi:hypothetical protein
MGLIMTLNSTGLSEDLSELRRKIGKKISG